MKPPVYTELILMLLRKPWIWVISAVVVIVQQKSLSVFSFTKIHTNNSNKLMFCTDCWWPAHYEAALQHIVQEGKRWKNKQTKRVTSTPQKSKWVLERTLWPISFPQNDCSTYTSLPPPHFPLFIWLPPRLLPLSLSLLWFSFEVSLQLISAPDLFLFRRFAYASCPPVHSIQINALFKWTAKRTWHKVEPQPQTEGEGNQH